MNTIEPFRSRPWHAEIRTHQQNAGGPTSSASRSLAHPRMALDAGTRRAARLILAAGMLVLPESPRVEHSADRPRARRSQTDRRVGVADAASPPATHHRHQPCDVPADYRNQHCHLFCTDDLSIGGPVLRRDLNSGDSRRWRGQCHHDHRVDSPDRSARSAAIALLESREHGSYVVGAGWRVLFRRVWPTRLGRSLVGCRLCRLLRNRTGTGLLVADRGELPPSPCAAR